MYFLFQFCFQLLKLNQLKMSLILLNLLLTMTEILIGVFNRYQEIFNMVPTELLLKSGCCMQGKRPTISVAS